MGDVAEGILFVEIGLSTHAKQLYHLFKTSRWEISIKNLRQGFFVGERMK
jgi:hypothetical protein